MAGRCGTTSLTAYSLVRNHVLLDTPSMSVAFVIPIRTRFGATLQSV
jgi:hypothetical protein